MNEDSIGRLYELLPVIYRQRDAEMGWPLKSLLQVISEQVDVVERDIDRLYENWFIETCDDWVVPYISDLVGYRPVYEAGEPGDANTPRERERNRILIPRREVANTVRNRRRKGTLSILELLAHDVAGWPARAVEFYKLLAIAQPINHPRPERGRTVDLRSRAVLGRLGSSFDELAHAVDVRRIGSHRSRGRYNHPNVGLFVWRHRTYSVTESPAAPAPQADTPKGRFLASANVKRFAWRNNIDLSRVVGSGQRGRIVLKDVTRGHHRYTFSALGNDTQLYRKPVPEAKPTEIADERNLPVAIRRQTSDLDELYGAGRSLYIRYEDSQRLILPQKIVLADLSDWRYTPPKNKVALDPELGRIAFNPDQDPPKGLRVFYRYAFSTDVGGGEYHRPVLEPAEQLLLGTQDLKEKRALISDLRNGTALSRYLLKRFTEETRCGLQTRVPSRSSLDKLVGRVIDELNQLMQGEDLYAAAKELRDGSGSADGQGAKAQTIQRLADVRPRGWDLVSLNRMVLEWVYPDAIAESFALYRVGEDAQRAEHTSISAALERWKDEKPRSAVIEITDSRLYSESLHISLGSKQTLHLRAADRARPVIRLPNYLTGDADRLRISGKSGSRFALDGLLIAGNAVRAEGELAELTISHCTLVPGWTLLPGRKEERSARPSLQLHYTPDLRVVIENSILGPIRVIQDEVRSDPVRISLADSVLDAPSRERKSVYSSGDHDAHARLTFGRSTVLGNVQVHAIDLAENSIFAGVVNVARRQVGCMRFCTLAMTTKSRTPKRYNCQPDLAVAALRETPGWQKSSDADERELQRVRPRFDSVMYGEPDYCRLSEVCAIEVKRGADDESEMGVFHDLFQPQREANLRARLDEYTPAGTEASVIFAS